MNRNQIKSLLIITLIVVAILLWFIVAKYASTQRSILIITAIIIISSVLFAIIISNRIIRPINRFVQLTHKGKSTESDMLFYKFGSFKQLLDLDTLLEEFGNQYEDVLEKSVYERNKLLAILESMNEGIIAIDKKGDVIHINPSAIELLDLGHMHKGSLNYEVIRKRFNLMQLEEIFEVLDADEVSTPLSDILIYGQCTMNLIYNRCKVGHLDGFIIVVDDISEKVSLEEKQNEFLANVSHELKTPITTIMSYGETMLDDMDGIDSSQKKEFIGIIMQEANRMSVLVSNLLLLNRIDVSSQALTKSRKDIVELLESCINSIRQVATKNNKQISLIYAQKKSIIVNIDVDAIERAIFNLISNSLKHVPSGGYVNIDVIEEKNHVKVLVIDNGIGIPPEAIPHLFDRFYRVDHARSKKLGGTGLGLAIVKQIIDEHRGSIEIKSSLGKGTVVIITLPKEKTRTDED